MCIAGDYFTLMFHTELCSRVLHSTYAGHGSLAEAKH